MWSSPDSSPPRFAPEDTPEVPSRCQAPAQLDAGAALLRCGSHGLRRHLLAFLVLDRSFHYIVAFVLAFGLAATSNFAWNRAWTFKVKHGVPHHQYARFLTVERHGASLDLAVLRRWSRERGSAKVSSAAIAILVATPVGSGDSSGRFSSAALVVAMAVLVAAGPAQAAARLTAHRAIGIAAAQPQAATLRLKNLALTRRPSTTRAPTTGRCCSSPPALTTSWPRTTDPTARGRHDINITPTVGKPRLNSVQAAAIAFRQAEIRQWARAGRNVSTRPRWATTASGRSTTTPPASRSPRCTSPTTPRIRTKSDGPAVQWQLAREQPRRTAQGQRRLHPVADVRAVPRRADQLAAAVHDAHARPCDAAVVRGVAVRLQQGRRVS